MSFERTLASVTQTVGNTPLVRIRNLAKDTPGVEVWAKLEYFNPGGSVKDRAGLQMLTDALADGRLKPGGEVIDSTSGNTGIALSWLGAALGLKVTLVMPSNVSIARKQITRAYGATLIFSDPLEGSDGAIRKTRQIIDAEPGRYFYPDQYSNPSNPRAHMLGTAPEIWEQTHGRITHFVAGLGTSGTVMGAGKKFRELNPAIETVAVEPLEPMHGLEGLKHMASSIVPAIYEPLVHHRKVSVATDAGWDMTEALLEEEGLAVGHSSGAALVGALDVARGLAREGKGGVVVALFCDRADRYFEPQRWEQKFEW
jgi:S-sulfo-L-cysteine synthase (O-acetyl-L-serine-dependent)